MASKDKDNLYDAFLTDVEPGSEAFSLEDILAEYGGSRSQKLMEDVARSVGEDPPPRRVRKEEKAAPQREKKPAEEAAQPPLTPREEARDKLLARAVDLEELEKDLPRPPRPVSLEEVVGSTVDAVMEEQEPLLKPRKGLFSRKKMEDTEQLYGPDQPEEEEETEPIGEEPQLKEAETLHRKSYQSRHAMLIPAFLIALLPTVVLGAEAYGLTIPYWTGDLKLQSAALLSCLALMCVLCRGVFARAVERLKEKRFTSELLVSLAALAAMGDCVMRMVSQTRSDVTPYGAVVCFGLFFAQWGDTMYDRGMYDTFHAAAMDDPPPYLIAETEKAACKQRGAVRGFWTTALRTDVCTMTQTVLLPIIAVGALVFSGLTSLGQDRGGDFLLHLSILLSAGGTFSLPLCFGLPWGRLARHLQKTGCAVAGWDGADKISRRRCMLVSDSDLFPPGAIQLNGMKIYGEERRKVVAYAASMAQAADCALSKLFDGILRGEMGRYVKVDQFSFYNEGGYSGIIRGETVLFGTASFMRKMDVRLPGDINLKTGVFLAVDRELIAVFAVKYNASENVDFALKLMRRNHIAPILAARDPNVTPTLLKRKFHKGVKVEYPSLTERVALSEAGRDQDIPRAVLFREGLLPYAETVVGSRRLVSAVWRSTVLAMAGSAVGLTLTAYLVSLGAYSLMTPLALELFLGLWALPVILMSDLAARY